MALPGPTTQPTRRISDQAVRYLSAVYGDGWKYKAPEQFANLVERWIWALAAQDLEFAETVMTELETVIRQAISEDHHDR